MGRDCHIEVAGCLVRGSVVAEPGGMVGGR